MRGRPAIERVLAAVVVDEVSRCWCCTIGIQANGYSHVQLEGSGPFELSHRIVYAAYVGPIREGMTIDHVAARGCTHKNCVNPDHLEQVTQAENIRRSGSPSAIAARNDICQRGHSNWRPNGPGKRTCRTCLLERRAA